MDNNATSYISSYQKKEGNLLDDLCVPICNYSSGAGKTATLPPTLICTHRVIIVPSANSASTATPSAHAPPTGCSVDTNVTVTRPSPMFTNGVSPVMVMHIVTGPTEAISPASIAVVTNA